MLLSRQPHCKAPGLALFHCSVHCLKASVSQWGGILLCLQTVKTVAAKWSVLLRRQFDRRWQEMDPRHVKRGDFSSSLTLWMHPPTPPPADPGEAISHPPGSQSQRLWAASMSSLGFQCPPRLEGHVRGSLHLHVEITSSLFTLMVLSDGHWGVDVFQMQMSVLVARTSSGTFRCWSEPVWESIRTMSQRARGRVDAQEVSSMQMTPTWKDDGIQELYCRDWNKFTKVEHDSNDLHGSTSPLWIYFTADLRRDKTFYPRIRIPASSSPFVLGTSCDARGATARLSVSSLILNSFPAALSGKQRPFQLPFLSWRRLKWINKQPHFRIIMFPLQI